MLAMRLLVAMASATFMLLQLAAKLLYCISMEVAGVAVVAVNPPLVTDSLVGSWYWMCW